MNHYYTRHNIAKLACCSYRKIMLLDQSQQIPGRTEIQGGARNAKFIYDGVLIDEWLKTVIIGPEVKPLGSKARSGKKKKTVSTITFRDIISGKFLPKDERLENFSRLIVAQASRPVTQRVSFKGVY